MQDIFHIGIPKSGTTSIQRTLKNDERILLTRSRYFTSKDWWLDKKNKISTDKIIIESNETLISGGFQKVKFIQVIERIYTHNKKASIIITIREQESALKSMFKHHINNNFAGTKTFKNWIYNTNLGIDFISICMYGNIAKALLSYFPKENIHFLFFEDLKENPKEFYVQLYSIIGIPFIEDIISKEALNVSPFNNDQLYTLSKMNRWSLTKVKSSSHYKNSRLRTLENRIKKGIIRHFSFKANEDFFTLNNVEGIAKLREDFKKNNNTLLELGLVSEIKLQKYKYLV